MKVSTDKRLRDFEFWSGAKDRADLLTTEELDTLDIELGNQYPDGIDEGELNDLFWFEFDWICHLIGTTEEEVFSRD